MVRGRRWLWVLVLVGCAPSTDDRDAPLDGMARPDVGIACGASPEQITEACGRPLGPVATECSSDGEGWCCPFVVPPSSTDCACVPGTGGFARSPCECASRRICDLPIAGWGMRVDEHGCPTLEIRPPPVCVCLCPPKLDAGPPDAPDVGAELDAGPPDGGADLDASSLDGGADAP